MIPPSQITGFVLAGGKSSRFGSNKALAMVDGLFLLDKSLALLSPFCSKIFISGHYPEYHTFDYPSLPDIIPELGPMGGIYTALKQTESPYLLFVTCDMPEMTGSLLERLIEKIAPAEITLWQQEDGSLQIFPSLYTKAVLPIVERHIIQGRLSVRSLFDEVVVRKLEIRKEEEAAFKNVNHIADLNI